MLPEQPTQPEIFHQAHNGNGTIFSLEVDDAEAAYAKAKKIWHQMSAFHCILMKHY